MMSASSYEAVLIGPDVTLTTSVSLPGDNETHQPTIWQLYAAEVSAKSPRRHCGSSAEAQQQQHSVNSPLCEILITLNNLLIYLLTHTISNWPKYYSAKHSHTYRHAAKAVIVSISCMKRVRLDH